MKAKTINVNLKGFLYLAEIQRRERLKKNFTDANREFLTKTFNRINPTGWSNIMDGDMGGADEKGRWTSWTAQQMGEMLSAAGIEWTPGKDSEYIPARF